MDGRTDERKDGQMDGQTDGQTDRQTDRQTDKQTDERNNKPTNRLTDGQTKVSFVQNRKTKVPGFLVPFYGTKTLFGTLYIFFIKKDRQTLSNLF